MNPAKTTSEKLAELRTAIQQGINSGEASTSDATNFNESACAEKETRWKADHADFIYAYNLTVNEESLPLENAQTF